MGSIRRRPETGTLFLDVRLQGRRHRLQTPLPDTRANRDALSAVMARIQREGIHGPVRLEAVAPWAAPTRSADRPADGGVRRLTVAEFARCWQSWHKPTWRPATRESVETTLQRYLIPALGSRDLASIKRADLLDLRASLARHPGGRGEGPLSGRTVNRHFGTIKSLLAEGCRQLGIHDPTDGLPRLVESRPVVEPFSLDEIVRLMAAVPEHYRGYLVTRLYCGLRTAEAHGLRWADVDFSAGELHISSTLTRGYRQPPKTASSIRTLRMPEAVLCELAILAHQHHGPEDLVFRTPSGAPLHADNFCDRIWKPLLRRAGVRYRRPYVMRHTCATLLLASGEHPDYVSRTLGHTSTRLLFSTYSRYVRDLTRRDGSAFDALIRRAASRAVGDPRTPPADGRASATAASGSERGVST